MDKNIVMLGPVSIRKYGSNPSLLFLNGKIAEYTNKVYGKYGFIRDLNEDLDVEGILINTEYINKMCNNYTVYKRIISLYNIKSDVEFIEFMINNFDEIYHWKGKHFNSVTLEIIIRTTRKGNIGETTSLKFLQDTIFDSTKIIIDIEPPTIEEDVSGIDGKFKWGDKTLTIQVKPFKRMRMGVSDTGIISAFSQGSLSLSTDYLILYENDKFIVVKSRDVRIIGNNFEFNKEKIKKNFEIH